MEASYTTQLTIVPSPAVLSIEETKEKQPIFNMQMAKLIMNYVHQHAHTLTSRAIIHKKESHLPFTLAFDPASKEACVLFKKKGGVLGEGSSATVTLGFSLKTKTEVAVKSGLAHNFNTREREISKFLANQKLDECFVVTDKYFNYVKPVQGMPQKKTLAIFEKLDMSLADLLDEELTLLELIDIARTIANGLSILDQLGIVHMDMKPENILMKGSLPKIADFGLAAFKDKLDYGRGSPGFWAPEVFDSWLRSTIQEDYQFSFDPTIVEMLNGVVQNSALLNYLDKLPPFIAKPSADIWSFGVMLLSMINPNCFYEIQENEFGMFAFDPKGFVQALMESVKYQHQIRSTCNEFSVLENEQFAALFELINDCLKSNPEDRITADLATSRLNMIYDNLNPTYSFL